MRAYLGEKHREVTTIKNNTPMYITFIHITGMEGPFSRVQELVIRSFEKSDCDDFYWSMIKDINNGTLVPYRKWQDEPYYHGQNVDVNGQYCQIYLHNTKTNDGTYSVPVK